jgi:hypothetical protein
MNVLVVKRPAKKSSMLRTSLKIVILSLGPYRLVKVPKAELETWDREQDVLGQRIPISRDSSQRSDDGEAIDTDKKEV